MRGENLARLRSQTMLGAYVPLARLWRSQSTLTKSIRRGQWRKATRTHVCVCVHISLRCCNGTHHQRRDNLKWHGYAEETAWQIDFHNSCLMVKQLYFWSIVFQASRKCVCECVCFFLWGPSLGISVTLWVLRQGQVRGPTTRSVKYSMETLSQKWSEVRQRFWIEMENHCKGPTKQLTPLTVANHIWSHWPQSRFLFHS